MHRILGVFILGIIMVSMASADDGLYLGGAISYAMQNDSTVSQAPTLGVGESATLGYNQGGAVSFNLGYRIGIGRVEGELGYQRSGINELRSSSGNLDATGGLTQATALLNGYLDFRTGTNITPYIGAGVGVAQARLEDFNVSGSGVPNSSSSDTVNIFQVSLGGASRINERYDLDFRYRYILASDGNFDDITMDLSGYQLTFGVRYNF